MPKRNPSKMETEETSANSSSGEPDDPINGGDEDGLLSEYEKQRLSRIAENRKRMESLGLSKMASSLMSSSKKQSLERKKLKKGKEKMGESDNDEDYRPVEEELGSSSSDDNDYVGPIPSGSRKSKVKNKGLKNKNKVSSVEITSSSCYSDEDDAVRQAIALSLQGSMEGSETQVLNATHSEKTSKMNNSPEDSGKRKRKKLISSRFQMTEDELVVHFYQFDGDWKGGITANDIERVAMAHDFTWTDKELMNMIHCFDSDGDGKLSLDDFRRIVGRCNMIKEPSTPS